jgi:BirA family biotin operon repressor/biotin-[acetyl-CoA-carboxylase] ligase
VERLHIRNPFAGAVCLLAKSLGSTQDEARSLAGPSFPPGSLIAAEEQTAGRGRFPERRWESPAGLNLLFTVRLGPEAFRPGSSVPLPGLPLRIGAALCAAVLRAERLSGAAFPSPPRLKWPNDLLIGERKAAGILCEAGGPGLLVGVGINCNQRAFPPALARSATSLALELRREIDRWRLLEDFLEELSSELAEEAGQSWRERVEALLWRRGEEAAFYPGLEAPGATGEAGPAAGPLAGRVEGVDAEGSLLFLAEGEARPRSFASGELANQLTARPSAL